MDDAKIEKFRELVDQNHQWPDFYTFKFIVKAEDKDSLIALLDGHDVQFRESGKGNYVSVTSRLYVSNTEEVLEVYRLIASIPGIMSL